MSNTQSHDFERIRPVIRGAIWAAGIILFSIPVIAKLVNGKDMLWTVEDFIVAAIGIFIAVFVTDLGLKKASSLSYAIGAAIAVGICFLTVWANLAVGIVGNEANDINTGFFGVVIFAALAVIIARGRPAGMAKAMTATAIAQVTVGIIVAVLGYYTAIFTGVMTALWLLSAAMFRKAATDRTVEVEMT